MCAISLVISLLKFQQKLLIRHRTSQHLDTLIISLIALHLTSEALAPLTLNVTSTFRLGFKIVVSRSWKKNSAPPPRISQLFCYLAIKNLAREM